MKQARQPTAIGRWWRGLQPGVRWGGAVTLLLIALFFGYFAFGRQHDGSNLGPLATKTPIPRPALGKTVAPADYIAAVGGALADVQAAEGVGGTERSNRIASAVQRLEKVEGAAVLVRSGSSEATVEVDNTGVITALKSSDPNLRAIESGLSTLSTALSGPESSLTYLEGTKDGAASDADLRSVLSDSVFNYQEQLSPLQRFEQWLASLSGQSDPNSLLGRLLLSILFGIMAGIATFLGLQKLLSRWPRIGLSILVGVIAGLTAYVAVQSLDSTLQLIILGAGIIGLIVAAVAVGFIVAGVQRGSAPQAPRRISDLASVLGMNSVEARRKADEAAGNADFRLAIRFRGLAVLLALDEVGKLVFDRSATNREYLFRAGGTLHDELQPLLDRFDDIWYGGVPANEADWQDYNARAANVEALAQTPDSTGKQVRTGGKAA